MARPLKQKWNAEDILEGPLRLCGFSVVLSLVKGMPKLTVMRASEKDFMFEGQFDNDSLSDAGFSESMPFESRIALIRGALKGDRKLSVALTEDDESGVVTLNIRQHSAVGVEYALRLPRVAIAESKEDISEDSAFNASIIHQLAALYEDSDSEEASDGPLSEEHISDEHIADGTLVDDHTFVEERTFIEEKTGELVIEPVAVTGVTDTSLSDLKECAEEEFTDRFHLFMPVVSSDMSSFGDFLFDTRFEKGYTQPKDFKVSSDRKSATAKIGSQILLEPAVSCSGTHVVRFCVKKLRDCWFGLGLTDDCGKQLYNGCAFDSNGFVWINGNTVAKSQAFAGWKKGDLIKLTAHFEGREVRVDIQAPNGEYSALWHPQSAPIWFAFGSHKGNMLSIV